MDEISCLPLTSHTDHINIHGSNRYEWAAVQRYSLLRSDMGRRSFSDPAMSEGFGGQYHLCFSMWCVADDQSNGATYCGSPGDPRCTLIIVVSPKGPKGHEFATPGEAGSLEAHQNEGSWTFDALCTHFARRATVDGDKFAKRRKHVVVVGWVKECLDQGRLLNLELYARHEIM